MPCLTPNFSPAPTNTELCLTRRPNAAARQLTPFCNSPAAIRSQTRMLPLKLPDTITARPWRSVCFESTSRNTARHRENQRQKVRLVCRRHAPDDRPERTAGARSFADGGVKGLSIGFACFGSFCENNSESLRSFAVSGLIKFSEQLH